MTLIKANWYLYKNNTDKIFIQSLKEDCAKIHLKSLCNIESKKLEQITENELSKYMNRFKPNSKYNVIVVDDVKNMLFYGNIFECKTKNLDSLKELKYSLHSAQIYNDNEIKNLNNQKTELKYKRKQ